KRRNTRSTSDWRSDVCSSELVAKSRIESGTGMEHLSSGGGAGRAAPEGSNAHRDVPPPRTACRARCHRPLRRHITRRSWRPLGPDRKSVEKGKTIELEGGAIT